MSINPFPPPRDDPSVRKIHAFTSFFAVTLYRGRKIYDYSAVRRYTTPKALARVGQKAKNLFKEIDVILIPINQNNTHWTLVGIDFREKKLKYIDSFRGRDTVGGGRERCCCT